MPEYDHPTDAQANRLHLKVREEQLCRIEDTPTLCHWACGTVSPSALQPRPQFCVRPIGHPGNHKPEARYARHKGLVAARVRRYREREGLS
jgi:hypothetical protein